MACCGANFIRKYYSCWKCIEIQRSLTKQCHNSVTNYCNWKNQNYAFRLENSGLFLIIPVRSRWHCPGSLTTDLRTVIWSCTSTPPRCRYSAREPCPLAPRTSSFTYTTSLWLDMYVPQSTENFSLTAWLPGLPFLQVMNFSVSRNHVLATLVITTTTTTE